MADANSAVPLPEKYTRRCCYCTAELSDFAATDFCDEHEGTACRSCLACGDPLEADQIAFCGRCTA